MGPTHQRVLHLHVTGRCNLKCRHCYANSGPADRRELDPRVAMRAVEDAARLGFEVLSVSGGEPLLYPALSRLLAHARAQGMAVTVVTNGTLLDAGGAALRLADATLVGVSIDGAQEHHNAIRGSDGSLDRVMSGLAALRQAGLATAVNATVTTQSLEDVEALADLACSEGVNLLQLHPIEASGRARQMNDFSLASESLEYLFVLVSVLQGLYGSRLAIHLDLLHSLWVRENPALIYAVHPDAHCEGDEDSGLPSVIVVRADGKVVPVSHGVSTRFALGDLYEARLDTLVERYRHGGMQRFRALCERWYAMHSQRTNAPEVFNWHDDIARFSNGQRYGEVVLRQVRTAHQ